MLVIRLRRVGKKNQPAFKIIVTEKKKAPTKGIFIEEVGFWNPLTKERILKEERIKYWLSVGAKASDTIHNMLIDGKVIEGEKIKKHSKAKKKEKEVVKDDKEKEESKNQEKDKEEKPEEIIEKQPEVENKEDVKEKKEQEKQPEIENKEEEKKEEEKKEKKKEEPKKEN